jgi:hypothetical protein
VVCWDRRRAIVYDEAAVSRQVRRSGRRPSPTGWPWWATRPTASPAFPAGAPSRPRRCWPSSATWRAIPADIALWPLPAGRARRLAEALALQQEDARLYRRLATLRRDAPLAETLDDLAWRGARPEFLSFVRQPGRRRSSRPRGPLAGLSMGRKACGRQQQQGRAARPASRRWAKSAIFAIAHLAAIMILTARLAEGWHPMPGAWG